MTVRCSFCKKHPARCTCGTKYGEQKCDRCIKLEKKIAELEAKLNKKILCGECGSPMELRDSKHGKFYGCVNFPHCDGTHGAHEDGSPLGIPANKETKKARMAAHAAFDKLWKDDGPMTRTRAYQWMRQTMDMRKEEAHIGRFNISQCESLIEKVKQELGSGG